MATGQVEHRTPSRLEQHNRELRRREELGTVWTERNLLALLQEQGLQLNCLKRNAAGVARRFDRIPRLWHNWGRLRQS